jgi:YHS domain-containing protein
MKAQGLPQAALNRLKYPAGLDIKALQGEEIALSILAEIVQTRRSRAAKPAAQTPAKPKRVFDLTPAASQKALDPVCGMEVQIEGAKHLLDYAGTTYYFCCKGCQKAFAAGPEQYLQKMVPTGEALDPVCGMKVEIATAHYMSEFEGRLYYFCAAGCKLAFEKAPQTYLHSSDAR